MHKQYAAPELKLAGEADQVVFGGGSGGFDFSGEMIFTIPPYQDDQPTANEIAG